METIIDRVIDAAGHYEGTGDGAESGPFTAVIEVSTVLDGLGAELSYRATGPDGSLLHDERTLLALDMWSGEPTLYILCSELNGMGQVVQIGESSFSNGRGTEGFELQVDVVLGDDTLEYVWSWGAPGEDLKEQSRATLARVDRG